MDVWRCSSSYDDSNTGINLTYLSGGTAAYTVIGGFPLSVVSLVPTAVALTVLPSSSLSASTSSQLSSSIATSQLASTTQAAVTIAASAATSSAPPPALSTGAKIGLEVGIPLGAAIIVTVAFLAWRVLKMARKLEREAQRQREVPRASNCFSGSYISNNNNNNCQHEIPSPSHQTISGNNTYELSASENSNGNQPLSHNSQHLSTNNR